MSLTQNQLDRVQTTWKRIIGDEKIELELISGTLYGFTSELGALRLFREYNMIFRNDLTDMGQTDRHDAGYFFRLDMK